MAQLTRGETQECALACQLAASRRREFNVIDGVRNICHAEMETQGWRLWFSLVRHVKCSFASSIYDLQMTGGRVGRRWPRENSGQIQLLFEV